MPRRVAGGSAELLVFVAAVLLAGVTIRDGIGPHDEGLILAAAGRIADGQLPYRDFWTNYGPAEPVLLAGLVKLFGPSLLAWRIVRVLVGGVVAVLCLRIARAWGVGERWAAAAGLAAGSAVAWPLTSAPTVFALAPALGVLVVLATPHLEWSTGRLIGAGLLAGLAAWLRPELGLAAGLGGLLLTGGLAPAFRFAAVATATVAVLYLPFILAAPGDFADDVLGFGGIQGLQRLPFPLDPPADPNKAFETLFPALLVAASGLWLVFGRARPLALLPLVLAGLAYLLARTDEFHLVPLAAVLAPALAVGAAGGSGVRDRRSGSFSPEPPGRRSLLARVLLGVALGLIALHGLERQAGRVLHPPALAPVPGGVGDGVRTDVAEAAALRALIPRVRAIGRPVFVAPPRLDRVRVGNPLLNVLLGLPNPTRYDVIQPGVVTRDDVQEEIVADLERTRATVIRWRAPAATQTEDNGAGREQGSRRFDAFVARSYRSAFTAGDYEVLRPR